MLANEIIVMREVAQAPTLSVQAELVRDALIAAGLETPMVENGLSSEEKRIKIAQSMTEVMQVLGLDLNDDSLQDTPKRIAKMYVNEIFSGLDYHTFPKITQIENKMRIDWDSESPSSDYAELFHKMMQVHASAPYQINMACKDMFSQHANIIHMTDYVQDKGSSKHVAYAASKAALHNLTLSFAGMLAPKVKVNSIAPSLLMFNENDSDAYKQKALAKSILGVCPGAQEAVKAVNFLLNSDYITGQTIHLNGGRHLK